MIPKVLRGDKGALWCDECFVVPRVLCDNNDAL